MWLPSKPLSCLQSLMHGKRRNPHVTSKNIGNGNLKSYSLKTSMVFPPTTWQLELPFCGSFRRWPSLSPAILSQIPQSFRMNRKVHFRFSVIATVGTRYTAHQKYDCKRLEYATKEVYFGVAFLKKCRHRSSSEKKKNTWISKGSLY